MLYLMVIIKLATMMIKLKVQLVDHKVCSGSCVSMAESSASASNWIAFLLLEGSTSAVWKFRGFPASDGMFLEADKRMWKEVTCKLCQRKFKYCGNTSNMCLHLQTSHPTQFACMECDEAKKKWKKGSSGATKTGKLSSLFEGQVPLQKISPRWKQTDSICYFIAKDII